MALVASQGCTEFESGSDTPEAGGAESSEWGCLSTVASALPLQNAATEPTRAVRSLQLRGLTEATDLTGVMARACARLDPECLQPMTSWVSMGPDGWVDVPVYEGFDGYLEVTSPTMVPTLVFYSYALRGSERKVDLPLAVLGRELASSFGRLFAGDDALINTGVVVLRAFNCQGNLASGVRFTMNPPGLGWYYVDNLPVLTAEVTTESGAGGFSDVQPGVVVLEATAAQSGAPISPPVSVFVRQGWFTNLRFIP